MNNPKLKQHFEENMLDGDKIQEGQMLSAESVFEYVKDLTVTLDAYSQAAIDRAVIGAQIYALTQHVLAGMPSLIPSQQHYIKKVLAQLHKEDKGGAS